jgi:hypothetical protein
MSGESKTKGFFNVKILHVYEIATPKKNPIFDQGEADVSNSFSKGGDFTKILSYKTL